MMRITAPELEIAVLVLGMVILMVEAFITKIDKRILAFAAIAGLAMVFLASFFVARVFIAQTACRSSSSNSR